MEKDIDLSKISHEKVQQKLAETEDLVLIDVLTGDHFDKVHLVFDFISIQIRLVARSG